MALTVVKYRKTATGDTAIPIPTLLAKNRSLQQPRLINKQFMKLDGGTNFVINRIPASIKPVAKRSNAAVQDGINKSLKYSVQTIASAGTPLTSLQWQQTIGGPSGTTITTTSAPNVKKEPTFGTVIGSLPPNTTIQATGGSNKGRSPYVQQNSGVSNQVINPLRRPTIFIKRDTAKRTIRSITLELIAKNPLVHLGVNNNYMQMLKNVIVPVVGITLVDCYLTLKKLRQNEEFAMLGEYFEMTEIEAQQTFSRSICKLARYMRALVRWPDSKRYYDRHKDLPFAYRANLSHVQSLIDIVETEMNSPMDVECNTYKFILSITPSGIISYVSEAFVGHHDDLTIFKAVDFNNIAPPYLSLVVDPGKALRRKRKSRNNQNHGFDSATDSAEESADEMGDVMKFDIQPVSKCDVAQVAHDLANLESLSIVNHALTSSRVNDMSVPTVRVRESACREQIREMIENLREFKILQPYAIQEPQTLLYLSEIIITAAALTNLQR